ncbi:hypothetical protein DFH07DRAFT_970192 [Mycena maculata]|uniref:Uncharacterized protein n=1 Tax=Mycena maculata TaxID=230809 RepID=A0AAD7HSM7_9AGAR|nr:hypothetical protein DFH07DRAFT_970192 [Mycena maculata]
MPSSSLPQSTPPSSPSRATLDNLLELVQQVTPSKSSDALRRLRRNIQARTNKVQEDVSTLKRRITDLENQTTTTTTRPRKQRKRFNRAEHADDSIPNPLTVEERAREKGRQFLIEEALFLVDSDVFTVDEDEDFDPADEFSSDKNKIQGQLLQILRYLPNDIKHLRKTDLISGVFIDGMSGQRSSISNRLRGASLPHIVDDVKPFKTSSGRFNAFATLIGYQPGTDTREPYYSKLDVPILYDRWQGKKDLKTFLRGPVLLNIHASIIRGPNGAIGLFSGKSKRPTANATLAIWMHSADTQLVEIGDETGINYRERQSYYLERILDGLANDKAWAQDLVAYWDHILFPNADAPRDGAAGNQSLEAGEDEDDFFGSVPPVERPPMPLADSSGHTIKLASPISPPQSFR